MLDVSSSKDARTASERGGNCPQSVGERGMWEGRINGLLHETDKAPRRQDAIAVNSGATEDRMWTGKLLRSSVVSCSPEAPVDKSSVEGRMPMRPYVPVCDFILGRRWI